MNLKHLTDQALLIDTELAVKNEKKATIVVLYHLKEVDRRRLYADLKYSSLIEYAKGQLNYEGGEAYRRVAAMNLLTEIPEIAPALESGKLNLTHLNMAQTHFNKERKVRGEKLTRDEKKDTLRKVVGTSTRQAVVIIAKEASYEQPKTTKLEVDLELVEKMKKLKDLLAHAHPNLTDNDLLHLLVDQALTPKKSKIQKEIYKRDEGKCTNCGSTHALEVDHRIPKSAGGADTPENLRLLCRNCNQRSAIRFFGAGKMETYCQ